MSAIVAAASPLELAALWRLDLLTARDVVLVCLTWLEQGLDAEAPDIAVLAGEVDPRILDLRPRFERVLADLIGAPLSRDEALPIALRLHLAVALVQPDERFVEAMDLVMARFKYASESRLVVHPRRLTDRPDETFAEQALGLEYVYGVYDELDDLLGGQMLVDDPVAMKARCLEDLREEAAVLHAHLVTL
ncbi:hypothetical protein [Caulobacter soli]|uniref:hypothetical protein n=1 Tax=Caulobacter soli TaxID=2708539 RepID=UPI0013ED671C|nr:hypothetical protein [Caulobacter soli]